MVGVQFLTEFLCIWVVVGFALVLVIDLWVPLLAVAVGGFLVGILVLLIRKEGSGLYDSGTSQ